MAKEDYKHRIFLLIILGLLLVSLSYYYNQENEKYLVNPSYGTILTDYPLGSVVQVNGDVIKILKDEFVIEENYKGKLIIFRVSSNASVKVGDKVDLLGVLGPDNTIILVDKMIINELWKYYFILFRSFLAMMVLIFLFFYYWKFDFSKFVFRRR